MPSDHKYKRLDSIRGLAAFSVGIGHAVLCVPFAKESWWSFGILGIFNGYYAVDIFFVLSGFVLTNMVREFSGPTYAAYLGRRLLRLYPPLWIALGIAAVAEMIIAARGWPCRGLSAFGCGFIRRGPPGLYGALRSAFPTDYRLNPVIWSIRVEIEASLAYPLLLFLWRKSAELLRIVMIAAAVLMTCLSRDGFSTPQPHFMLFFVGLPHYLLLFLAGIAVSDYRPSRAIQAKAALSLGGGLMLASGFFFRGHSGIDDVIATASAALLISAVAYRCPVWLGTVLDCKPIRRLGEVSYSYYLLNGLVLWVIARVLARWLTTPKDDLHAMMIFGVLAATAALVGSVVAYAMNRAVERPSISWSRAVEKHILSALTGRAQPTSASA